jgi:hypothetical protein
MALNVLCVRPAGRQAEVQGRQVERGERGPPRSAADPNQRAVLLRRGRSSNERGSRRLSLQQTYEATPLVCVPSRHIRAQTLQGRGSPPAPWGIIDRGNTSGCRLAGTLPRTAHCARRPGGAVRALAQCAICERQRNRASDAWSGRNAAVHDRAEVASQDCCKYGRSAVRATA